MIPTDQQDPEGVAGSEPENQPKGNQEPRMVPLGELVEVRQENRALQERLAKLEAKLAGSQDTSSKQASPKAPPDDDLRATVAQIAAKERVRELVGELGLFDSTQGASVAAVLAKMPDLSPVEALQIAASREPDKFKDREQGTGRPPAMLRPSPGANPPPKQDTGFKERLEYTRKIAQHDKRRHREYANNLQGKFLAEALGWEHQLLPIPKQE
jgi:hypothetical protein